MTDPEKVKINGKNLISQNSQKKLKNDLMVKQDYLNENGSINVAFPLKFSQKSDLLVASPPPFCRFLLNLMNWLPWNGRRRPDGSNLRKMWKRIKCGVNLESLPCPSTVCSN